MCLGEHPEAQGLFGVGAWSAERPTWVLDRPDGWLWLLDHAGSGATLPERYIARTTPPLAAGLVCWYYGVRPDEALAGLLPPYGELLDAYGRLLEHATAEAAARWLGW